MQEIQNIFQFADEETHRRIVQDLRGRPFAGTIALLPALKAGKIAGKTLGNETRSGLVRTELQSMLKDLA
jgi:hypothetical protein